jgi:hypothetical protein
MVLMLVTPEMASHWLESHNQVNRDIKPSVVRQYSRDMRLGLWEHPTHQAIGFDINGQLVDGQQRMAAIKDSGCSIWFYVMTGCNPHSRHAVDLHSKRSVKDAFTLSGRNARIKVPVVPVNSAAGMWARMMHGNSNHKGGETRSELLHFSDTHSEAGEWTLEQFGQYPKQSKIYTAPVMAAFARATYYFADRDRLSRAIEVICTGISRDDQSEETLIHWRNWLTMGHKRNSNSQAELYGKTCKAIQAFMRCEVVSKFYQPKSEPFPLPGQSTKTDSRTYRVASHRGQLFTGRSGAVEVAEAGS